MAHDQRKTILEALEAELDAPVLAFVTGDRPNLETGVSARDQLPLFPRHLDALGHHEKLALLLYTRGGDTNAAWPIVNFVRAYCKHVIALVPFFAHSAGTLMSLGANDIYMSKIATLSPIDPSVANAFNPEDPGNPQNRIQIAVEDVIAYFELARSQGVKRDEDVAAAFSRLAEAVHPLALGNVHRSIEQIRQLAEKLIRLHSPEDAHDEVQERIRRLTTAFYTHSHMINRSEAGALGLPVREVPDAVEKLLLDYYEQLIADLELKTKFDPSKFVAQAGAQPQTGTPAPQNLRFERAILETKTTCDVFVTEGIISMQPPQLQGLPPGVQPPALPAVATFEITNEEWEEIA